MREWEHEGIDALFVVRGGGFWLRPAAFWAAAECVVAAGVCACWAPAVPACLGLPLGPGSLGSRIGASGPRQSLALLASEAILAGGFGWRCQVGRPEQGCAVPRRAGHASNSGQPACARQRRQHSMAARGWRRGCSLLGRLRLTSTTTNETSHRPLNFHAALLSSSHYSRHLEPVLPHTIALQYPVLPTGMTCLTLKYLS